VNIVNPVKVVMVNKGELVKKKVIIVVLIGIIGVMGHTQASLTTALTSLKDKLTALAGVLTGSKPSIEDPKVEKLRDFLKKHGIETHPDDLATLDLSKKGKATALKEIPDLSPLKKLTELNLSGNKLTTIPGLSALTNLQTLDLRNNPLKGIADLSKLTNLEALYLPDREGLKIKKMPDQKVSIMVGDRVLTKKKKGSKAK